jgi:hypothetical protein
LTGGYILSGMHEVIVSKETVESIKKAKEQEKILWRVSSTLFSHVSSDEYLTPLGKFATEENQKKYPKTFAGDQVLEELKMINLANDIKKE